MHIGILGDAPEDGRSRMLAMTSHREDLSDPKGTMIVVCFFCFAFTEEAKRDEMQDIADPVSMKPRDFTVPPEPCINT